jgi:pilin/secretion family protein with methylation motif
MECAHRRKNKDRKANQGFSIIELMVSVVLTAMVVAVVYSLYVSYSKVVISQDDKVEIQQMGRTGVQMIRNDLMMVGGNVRTETGQDAMVFAAPWEMVYNGDISPHHAAMEKGASVSYNGPGTPYYGNNVIWESSAETIHYYWVNTTNSDEDYSWSPYDGELRRNFNGSTDFDRISAGVRWEDGLDFGYSDGTRLVPLFTYLGDFDFDGDQELWGDGNGNGTLEDNEIATLLTAGYAHSYTSASGIPINVQTPKGAIYLNEGPSNSEDTIVKNNQLDEGEDVNGNGRLDLNLLDLAIHRIDVNMTTVSRKRDPNYSHPNEAGYQFREHHVSTSVDLRNINTARETPCGEPPEFPSGHHPGAGYVDCNRSVEVTWTAAIDDGTNHPRSENDIQWYEVWRQVKEGSGWSGYQYYSYVPATGQTSYDFVDGGLEYDDSTGDYLPLQYMIVAVDTCDLRTTSAGDPAAPNSALTAPDPPENVTAWDSPCFLSGPEYGLEVGSITLQFAEPTNTAGVDEYWVYRSVPGNPYEVIDFPVAKLKPTAGGIGGDLESCAGLNESNPTTEQNAHLACTIDSNEPQFWTYTSSELGNKKVFAWRDEPDSPGREGGSLVPENSSGQFATTSTTNRTLNHYRYHVKSYNSSNECLSDEAVVESACGGEPFDVSSLEPSTDSELDKNMPSFRARYSPPRDLSFTDTSTYEGGLNTAPSFTISWKRSQTEWCDEVSEGDAADDIPDITRYYVYRSRSFVPPFFPGYSAMVDTGGSFSFDSADNNIMVFLGPVVDTASQTAEYTFTDSNIAGTSDPTQTAYPLSQALDDSPPGTEDFRPAATTVPLSGDMTGRWGLVYQSYPYEYMVAAVHANTSDGTPDLTPWSWSTSCVISAYFGCDAVLIDDARVEQCDVRGGSDNGAAYIWWQFDPLGEPPAGSTLTLETLEPSTGVWETINSAVVNSGNWYYAPHPYSMQESPGGQYSYRVRVQFPDRGCDRYVDVRAKTSVFPEEWENLTYDAGEPDAPSICYDRKSKACDDTSNSKLNCVTGKVGFEFTDRLPYCSDVVDTQKKFIWFRISRWSKPASNDPDNGKWPWCDTIYSDPEGIGCGDPRSTRSPGYPAIQDPAAEFWVRADNTCPGGSSTFTCADPGTYFFDKAANPSLGDDRTYQFREFVNPSLDFWYEVDVIIDHSIGAGGTNNPEYCNAGTNDNTCSRAAVITYDHVQCYPNDSWQHFSGTTDWDDFEGFYDPYYIHMEDPSAFEPNVSTDPWNTVKWSDLIDGNSTYSPSNEARELSYYAPYLYDDLEGRSVELATNEARYDALFTYMKNRYSSDSPNTWWDYDPLGAGEILDPYDDILDDDDDDDSADVPAPVTALCSGTVPGTGLPLLHSSNWGSTCKDDLTELYRKSYLWSNFEDTCGADDTAPDPQAIDGNLLWQFSVKSGMQDKYDIAPVFRASYNADHNSFEHYFIWIDQDVHGSSDPRKMNFHLGFAHDGLWQYWPSTASATIYAPSGPDREDWSDNWWTMLLLACNGTATGDEDSTYVMAWIKNEDGDKEPEWDWQQGGNSGWFYDEDTVQLPPEDQDPVFFVNTNNLVLVDVDSSSMVDLGSVDNQDGGRIGFYNYPFYGAADELRQYHDNMRVTQYCGECPPSGFGLSKAMQKSQKSGGEPPAILRGGDIVKGYPNWNKIKGMLAEPVQPTRDVTKAVTVMDRRFIKKKK